ncbi:MAG TPA: MFS transporter [Anaerolineales bacterium]|nr:MFS transporter [Anaerolineales bacterium]
MTANINAPSQKEEIEPGKCSAYMYQGRIKCPNCQCPANMYPIENSGDLIKNKRNQLFSREMWSSVGRNVFFLGLTSLLTDISSEMVTATLPLYLLLTLRLAPLQFGLIDGINQGASVLVRIASGLIADRWRRAKEVATAGYAFSAICRIGLLLVGRSWLGLSGVVLLDRIGKGIRTAPRDAMIAQSVSSERLATAFGVHRAMDTAGAMLGPLIAAGLLFLAPGSYDAVFIVSFCFAIVGVAVIVLLVEAPTVPAPPAAAHPVTSRIVGQLLSRPDFRALVLISSALALTTLSDSFIFLTLQRKHDLGLSLFPLLYVGMALVYMVLAIPIGRLADRMGRRQIFLAGYGFLALAYGLLLLPGIPQEMSLGILLLLGLYYAATDGVLSALASAMLPEQWRTTGLAIMTTGTGLARLLASLGYGALWTYLGPSQALTLFLVALSITVLVAWLFLSGVERRSDERVQ